MTPGSRRRRAARVAAALAIASSTVVLGLGAASGASDLSVTRSDGSDAAASTTTSHTCLTVVGTVPTSLTPSATSMTIVDPGGASHGAGSVSSSPTNSRQITFHLGTRSTSWTDSCSSGGPVAPNGTYTARLSGGVTSSLSFAVAVPPPAPSSFTGSTDRTVADFSWQRNSEESDFIGYEIESGGRSVTGVMQPGGVCGSTTCSVTVDFGPAAAGNSMSFVARAIRADGSGGQARSDASSPLTLRFPAAPNGGGGASAAGAPGGAPSAGSGTGRPGVGSSGRHGPALSGRHPAAELRAYLPTVSAGQAPDLPSVVTQVKPLPEGTYDPRLAYPDRLSRPGTRADAGSALARDAAHVFSAKPLWRGLAGAALMFLVVAHLRAWLARLDASDAHARRVPGGEPIA